MNNTTTFSTELISETQAGFIWGISITLTITIVIINVLTIYIIRTVDTLREKYGVLLVAYCAVDILNGLHVTYLQLRLWLLVDSYVPSCEWKNILVYSFDALPIAASSWHTVLLTFDRYIAVCYPFKYHRIMTQKIQKTMVLVIWVISILENFGPHLYFKAFKCRDMIWKAPNDFDSRFQFSHVTLLFMLHFIMYSRIWWIAHKMRQRSVEAFSDNPPVKRGILDKATMTVFCVVVLSYVIWVPYVMSRFLSDNLESNQLFLRFTVLLGFSGSFVNNIIYVIINKNFRDGFKRLVCKRNDI